MNKFISLFKTEFQSVYSLSFLKYSLTKTKKSKFKVLVPILLIISMLPLYFFYILGVNLMIQSLISINQGSAVIAMGITATTFVILFFSVFYIFSAFFKGKDLELLLSLPVKPSTIFTSKLLNIIIREYFLVIAILAPIFICYGLAVGASVLFYIYALITLICVPVIPICLTTLVMLLLAKILNFKGFFDKMELIMTVVIFGLLFGFVFLMNSFTGSIEHGADPNQLIMQLLKDNTVLINTIGNVYPPGKMASLGFLNYANATGLLYMLGFVGISILLYFTCDVLSNKIFVDVVMNSKNSTGESKKVSYDEVRKDIKSSPKWLSIFKNDLNTLLRNTTYLLNTFGMVIIMPLALSIGFLSSSKEQGINMLIDMTGNYFFLGILLLLIFVAAANPVAGTTFSREGKAYWVGRTLPIKPKDNLIGRSLNSVIINLLTFITVSLLLFVFAGASIPMLIMTTLTAFFLSMPITMISLIVDLKKPYLDWDNEAKAVKQNMNYVYVLLASFPYMAVLAGVCALLILVLSFSVIAVMGVLSVIGLILSLLAVKVYLKQDSQTYFG